jgi:glycosyltransferase involved in cell wall biosynthesis
VVPAFDEAPRVGRVVARIPEWVDRIVVVDDASRDETPRAARIAGGERVRVISHDENRGVGAAIVTGYRHAVREGADVIAVMAGDDQMDPGDLDAVVAPVIAGVADYVKGNRFMHADVRRMPLHRRLAGKALAVATRLATGLAIDDSQCGYTAISRRAVLGLPLHDLWPRYGYPNDLLALLAEHRFEVAEVPVKPVYAGQKSGVRAWHALLVLALLARRVARARRSRINRAADELVGPAERVAHVEAALELAGREP